MPFLKRWRDVGSCQRQLTGQHQPGRAGPGNNYRMRGHTPSFLDRNGSGGGTKGRARPRYERRSRICSTAWRSGTPSECLVGLRQATYPSGRTRTAPSWPIS